MKNFRAFLTCSVVVSFVCVLAGCATTGQDSTSTSQTSPASGMKGIEQSSPSDTWADSLGQFLLNSLYATAVANQSN